MKSGLKNRRAKERRQRVIVRLEKQLKDKTKAMKADEGTTVNAFVGFRGELPLTPSDEKRIKKELAILNERI